MRPNSIEVLSNHFREDKVMLNLDLMMFPQMPKQNRLIPEGTPLVVERDTKRRSSR